MMRTLVRTGQGVIVHNGYATTYDHETGDLWLVDEQGGVEVEYRAGDYLQVTTYVVDPDEPDEVAEAMERGDVGSVADLLRRELDRVMGERDRDLREIEGLRRVGITVATQVMEAYAADPSNGHIHLWLRDLCRIFETRPSPVVVVTAEEAAAIDRIVNIAEIWDWNTDSVFSAVMERISKLSAAAALEAKGATS